jgi:hypothetical protein
LGPSEVELVPFPFQGDRLDVAIEAVHLERSRFGSDDELQAQVRSTKPEVRHTAYVASGDI